MSFCDFSFIAKNFKFLKTVIGRGFFNLFIASMFLVGNAGSIWGWIMFAGYLCVGVFFVLVGCACLTGYEDTDLKRDDIKVPKSDKDKKESSPAEETRLLDTA